MRGHIGSEKEGREREARRERWRGGGRRWRISSGSVVPFAIES